MEYKNTEKHGQKWARWDVGSSSAKSQELLEAIFESEFGQRPWVVPVGGSQAEHVVVFMTDEVHAEYEAAQYEDDGDPRPPLRSGLGASPDWDADEEAGELVAADASNEELLGIGTIRRLKGLAMTASQLDDWAGIPAGTIRKAIERSPGAEWHMRLDGRTVLIDTAYALTRWVEPWGFGLMADDMWAIAYSEENGAGETLYCLATDYPGVVPQGGDRYASAAELLAAMGEIAPLEDWSDDAFNRITE